MGDDRLGRGAGESRESIEAQRLRDQIVNLRREIDADRRRKVPTRINWENQKAENAQASTNRTTLRPRGTLTLRDEGNCAKICFGKDRQLFMMTSGADSDGNSVVWNTSTRTRTMFVKMESCWQLGADIEKKNGILLGTGGLEENLNIFKLRQDEVLIQDHEEQVANGGLVSCTKFLKSDSLLASAGRSVKLYNVENVHQPLYFNGHTGDTFSIAPNKADDNVFVSGGGDFTARLWDIRSSGVGNEPRDDDPRRGNNTHSFFVGSRDVNGLDVFPTGDAFAAALNNCETHIYDLKANCKLLTLKDAKTENRLPAEDVKFSNSGRLCFVTYKDGIVLVFDMLSATSVSDDQPVINRAVQQLPGNRGDLYQCIDMDSTTLAGGFHRNDSGHCSVNLFWPVKGKR